LQQMHAPNPVIPNADSAVTGTEADGLFLKRDRLFYRPGQELAQAKVGSCGRHVRIGPDHRLVFGNGLRASAPRRRDEAQPR
jgi:hypothetical protein